MHKITNGRYLENISNNRCKIMKIIIYAIIISIIHLKSLKKILKKASAIQV